MSQFISYAQNFEDVMLWRALRDVERGFYIDIGANLPHADSVTKAFYDRGWHGVNVEPDTYTFGVLAEGRPRDINLHLACWQDAGLHTLYLIDESAAFSTLEPAMAEIHRQAGRTVREVPLQTTTLAALCAEYVGERDIHFLKIDVEGGEVGVVRGADFSRWRPWIILGEAHGPDPRVNFYQPWEDILLRQGYGFAYCDGLIRFYIADEHRERLAPAFMVPPNVYDEFVRAPEAAAIERIAFDEQARAEALAQVENAKQRIVALESELVAAQAQTEAAGRDVVTPRRVARQRIPGPMRRFAWRFVRTD